MIFDNYLAAQRKKKEVPAVEDGHTVIGGPLSDAEKALCAEKLAELMEFAVEMEQSTGKDRLQFLAWFETKMVGNRNSWNIYQAWLFATEPHLKPRGDSEEKRGKSKSPAAYISCVAHSTLFQNKCATMYDVPIVERRRNMQRQRSWSYGWIRWRMIWIGWALSRRAKKTLH